MIQDVLVQSTINNHRDHWAACQCQTVTERTHTRALNWARRKLHVLYFISAASVKVQCNTNNNNHQLLLLLFKSLVCTSVFQSRTVHPFVVGKPKLYLTRSSAKGWYERLHHDSMRSYFICRSALSTHTCCTGTCFHRSASFTMASASIRPKPYKWLTETQTRHPNKSVHLHQTV